MGKPLTLGLIVAALLAGAWLASTRQAGQLGDSPPPAVTIMAASVTWEAPIDQPTQAPFYAVKSTPNLAHTPVIIMELTEPPGAPGPRATYPLPPRFGSEATGTISSTIEPHGTMPAYRFENTSTPPIYLGPTPPPPPSHSAPYFASEPPPGDALYARTYRHVWCFNSADEAEAAGYRRAEHQAHEVA